MSGESTKSGGGSGAARTQPLLLDQVHNAIRRRYFSRRTEEAYVRWIKRFIYFHGKQHPRDMEGPQVEAFLSHLATAGRVAPSTQNQALSALLFLYREVLQVAHRVYAGINKTARSFLTSIRLPKASDSSASQPSVRSA